MNFQTLKTTTIAAAAVIALSACAANATLNQPTSAVSSTQAVGVTATSTVAQVKTLQDDAKVTLQGKVIRHIRHEKFELQDRTGSVIVEIDDDYYRSPQELVGKTVTIHGEVSKNSRKFEIDADVVQIH